MSKSENVKLFKIWVYKYINFFDLSDWEITIEELIEKYIRATVLWDEMASNRIANFYYEKEWIENNKLTKDEIQRVAFHEVLELLLANLRVFSVEHKEKISSREVDTEIHRIIRKLENKVFNLIKL